jgi:alanyl-tRNA synthetase
VYGIKLFYYEAGGQYDAKGSQAKNNNEERIKITKVHKKKYVIWSLETTKLNLLK